MMSKIRVNWKLGMLTVALFCIAVATDPLGAQQPSQQTDSLAEKQLASAMHPRGMMPNGDRQSQSAPAQDGEKTKPQPVVISRARRAELLRFVRENHSELEPLVRSLKDKRPAQFNAALRSLDKAVTSLNKIKSSQNEQRYNQALEDWKLRSRIQLLSAQLSINDTPNQREQLERLITRKIDNRISQLNAEIDKNRKRLERLNELATELESNRTAEIQRQLESAVRSAKRIKSAREKSQQKDARRQPKNNKTKDSK